MTADEAELSDPVTNGRRPIEGAILLANLGIPDLPLARRWMCECLRGSGVTDDVLDVLMELPRHAFATERWRVAYLDIAVAARDTWLHAPSTVARAVSALVCKPAKRVLEVGTSTGYQTAVIAALGADVTTVDTSAARSARAREHLTLLGLGGVRFEVIDDLDRQLPEGPFDAIVVNTARTRCPSRMLDAVAPASGAVVAAIEHSDGSQRLMRYAVTFDAVTVTDLGSCALERAPVRHPGRGLDGAT
jgi:protein-L-isoaspartate(D-aspartate) O-methyltransferase